MSVFHESDKLLKPREVALLFRVDPKTVTRWATPGPNGEPPKLPSLRTLGNHRRFRETEVRAKIRELSTELAVIDGAAADAVAATPIPA